MILNQTDAWLVASTCAFNWLLVSRSPLVVLLLESLPNVYWTMNTEVGSKLLKVSLALIRLANPVSQRVDFPRRWLPPNNLGRENAFDLHLEWAVSLCLANCG